MKRYNSLTQKQAIDRIEKLFPNKFDLSEVVYINNATKVKLTCNDCGGKFESRPANLFNGKGCSVCSRKEAGRKRKARQAKIFFFKANEVHNERYDYSLAIYDGAKKKLKIICKEHGAFEQLPTNHLKGHGCPECSYKKQRNFSIDEFIKKSSEVHNRKYDYSKVSYKNGSKVKIICPIHGEFQQNVLIHAEGSECPSCANDKKKGNTDSFIKRAKEIHGDRYDYSQVDYKNNRIKVKIICQTHGLFLQAPTDHNSGKGCPKCNLSHGERAINSFLKSKSFIFEIEKKFDDCRSKKRLPFDFYIESLNLLIEFDGEQHYKPSRFKNSTTKESALEALKALQKRDQIKTNYAISCDFNFVRIGFFELKNVEGILLNVIERINNGERILRMAPYLKSTK